jgi:hypothetical protein
MAKLVRTADGRTAWLTETGLEPVDDALSALEEGLCGCARR